MHLSAILQLHPYCILLCQNKEVNSVLVEPINGPYPHHQGHNQNRIYYLMSYKISHTNPNTHAEVCFNFLNLAFERKLEADIQLIYCLDGRDCVFKHICSAKL